jgi:CBS domain-containing protein
MNSAIERLLSLRVADVMSSSVVKVPVNASLADAAALLVDNDITGAPVVDESGRCVGVISSTDFMVRERLPNEFTEGMSLGYEHVLVKKTGMGSYQIEACQEDRVGEHMTPSVQTITETAPIMNAARTMCGEHIHRLIVADEKGRPVGIVSTLDLVAAMVAAIGE